MPVSPTANQAAPSLANRVDRAAEQGRHEARSCWARHIWQQSHHRGIKQTTEHDMTILHTVHSERKQLLSTMARRTGVSTPAARSRSSSCSTASKVVGLWQNGSGSASKGVSLWQNGSGSARKGVSLWQNGSGSARKGSVSLSLTTGSCFSRLSPTTPSETSLSILSSYVGGAGAPSNAAPSETSLSIALASCWLNDTVDTGAGCAPIRRRVICSARCRQEGHRSEARMREPKAVLCSERRRHKGALESDIIMLTRATGSVCLTSAWHHTCARGRLAHSKQGGRKLW